MRNSMRRSLSMMPFIAAAFAMGGASGDFPKLGRGSPGGFRKARTNTCQRREPVTAEDILQKQRAEDRQLRRAIERDENRTRSIEGQRRALSELAKEKAK